MITITLVLLALVTIEIIVASTAPVGYEDESGFHFGEDVRFSVGSAGAP